MGHDHKFSHEEHDDAGERVFALIAGQKSAYLAVDAKLWPIAGDRGLVVEHGSVGQDMHRRGCVGKEGGEKGAYCAHGA